MNRLVAIVVVLSMLAGCATSSVVTPPDRPHLTPPAASLMADCRWPRMAKSKPLTQAQVEALLGANADAQIDCWKRHHALAAFIRKRDAGLTQ